MNNYLLMDNYLGSIIKILATGEFGFVQEKLDQQYYVVQVITDDDLSTRGYILTPSEFEVIRKLDLGDTPEGNTTESSTPEDNTLH